MVLFLTIPAHTFAVNFSLNWSFLIRRKFCWAQYRVFRRLNMLFVIHQKNRRKKQNCGFHHQCEATNHSNPVFDQHHLYINILKRHGTEAWFIYHYGYFYQVMLNPLNALLLMLPFISLYTHFLQDIHIGVCSYSITDYRQYWNQIMKRELFNPTSKVPNYRIGKTRSTRFSSYKSYYLLAFKKHNYSKIGLRSPIHWMWRTLKFSNGRTKGKRCQQLLHRNYLIGIYWENMKGSIYRVILKLVQIF
jgi:hypothetical protein